MIGKLYDIALWGFAAAAMVTSIEHKDWGWAILFFIVDLFVSAQIDNKMEEEE